MNTMPISGLVLTLEADNQRRESVLIELRRDRRITVGVLHDHRLPIVLETTDAEESHEMCNRLHAIPGIMFVDVVCVHDEDHTEHVSLPATHRTCTPLSCQE